MMIDIYWFEVIAPKAGVDEVDDFLKNILTFCDEADVLELP